MQSRCFAEDRRRREEQAVQRIRSHPGFFYSYAKSFAKTRSQIPLIEGADGELVTSDLSREHETCCQTKHKEPRQTPTPTSKPSINQQRPTKPPHLHLPPKLHSPPTYKPPPTSKPPPTYTPPPTSKVQTSTSPPNLQTYTPPNAKKSGTAERPRPSDFLTQITNLLN
eukprot:sb/3472363/